MAFWVNTPDGKTIKGLQDGVDEDADNAGVEQANRQGQVTLSWTAPKNAIPGTSTLVAHGLESEREAVVTFIIR